MSLVTPRKGYKSVPWLFGKEIEIPEEWEIVKLKELIVRGNQGINTAIDKVEYVDKIRKSLAGAQKDRPDIYGKGDRDFSDQTNNRDIIKKRIMKEQGLLGIFKRLCSTEAQRELFSKVSFESAKQWGNNWYLLKNDPRNADNNFNGYSCFTIEGIDEEKSQEPIANFILNYVLKLNPITTK